MNVYLDHNIIDDISKGNLSLKPSADVIWIYSNENLKEIRRSGDDRFIEVLKNLDARFIELKLDNEFRITGEAIIHPPLNPYDVYNNHIESVGSLEDEEYLFKDLLGRLQGANNKDNILDLPENFEKYIEELLEPHDLYNNELKSKVSDVSSNLKQFTENELQNIGSLEETRKALGTNKGRATLTEEYDNPLEELWQRIKKELPNELTSEQFYGFDPVNNEQYDDWPIYLGIVGCHGVLNFVGYRPDKGLSNIAELSGIMSDGAHIAYGAYCQGLLTRDKRLISKAKAIYKFKGISTTVLTWNNNE